MTICHIVNFFYLHPPSKFEIYNITNEKSYNRRGSALWMSWGPNNCANFAAKVDLLRNWGQFHETYLRLRYILRKDFFIASFLIRFTKSVVSFVSSFVTLRQVNRCRKFKLNMAAVFILMCRRQLRRERQFRDKNNH